MVDTDPLPPISVAYYLLSGAPFTSPTKLQKDPQLGLTVGVSEPKTSEKLLPINMQPWSGPIVRIDHPLYPLQQRYSVLFDIPQLR